MSENYKVSQKQEKRIVKSFKQIEEESRLTIGSGNKWFNKSDVVTNRFRIEAKTKVKPSSQMTIKKEWLDKIGMEAFESNRIPLLTFSFGNSKDYVILSLNDFIKLLEEKVGDLHD